MEDEGGGGGRERSVRVKPWKWLLYEEPHMKFYKFYNRDFLVLVCVGNIYRFFICTVKIAKIVPAMLTNSNHPFKNLVLFAVVWTANRGSLEPR